METDKFIRSPSNSGAVLNTDRSGLEAYKKRKQREAEINTLRDEVSEIKQMLKQLLENTK